MVFINYMTIGSKCINGGEKMSYRRLFIIRKDLHLHSGKLAAMVGHCAESYWTRMIAAATEKTLEEYESYQADPGDNIPVKLSIPRDIYDNYINDSFVKVICEAKNLHHLMKAKILAEELGLVENKDFFVIADECRTDLIPEFYDEDGKGRTIVGIGFRPLPDEVAMKLSKKYQLYKG